MDINKKREEILAGIIDYISSGVKQDLPTGLIAGEIFDYLHFQGCVLKVDRELPIITDIGTGVSAKKEQVKMLKAGYEAVEPLIEEKRDADTAE